MQEKTMAPQGTASALREFDLPLHLLLGNVTMKLINFDTFLTLLLCNRPKSKLYMSLLGVGLLLRFGLRIGLNGSLQD